MDSRVVFKGLKKSNELAEKITRDQIYAGKSKVLKKSQDEIQKDSTKHFKQPLKTKHDDFENSKPESNPGVEKELPNFNLSSKLLEDTNKVAGVVVKYSKPKEAEKPDLNWKLFVYREHKFLETMNIYRQDGYLIGKDIRICDIPAIHPSCSGQHAVIQFRKVSKNNQDYIIPYLIDLKSTNGTFLNNQKIESERYYELFEKDVIKFGFSSREYVLMHDKMLEKEEATDEEDENSYKLAKDDFISD